jgi:tetratricopeptide (TPR) repeat protein
MDGKGMIKKALESILNNDFEQAIQWFEHAIDYEPDNASYHFRMSITCARSGKLDKAISHAQTAVKLDGQQDYKDHLRHLEAVQLVRQAERRLNQPVPERFECIQMLEQAVRLDPLCLEAHLLLGAVYMEQGQFEQASEALHEVLRLNPNYESARSMLETIQKKH